MEIHLDVATLTDQGSYRENNEDFTGHFVPAGPAALAQNGALFAVADGVGGSPAGEVASSEAVNVLLQEYFFNLAGRAPAARLREAVTRATTHVFGLASSHKRLRGMQTTLSALLLLHNTYFVAHIGDSKVYQIRGRRAKKLTTDHAVGQMLTRAVGMGPIVQTDYVSGTFQSGDTFVLSTDGLFETMSSKEICHTFAISANLDAAAAAVVEEAKRRHSQDNLTVLAARVFCSGVEAESQHLPGGARGLSSLYPVSNQAALLARLMREREDRSDWEDL